MFLAVILGKGLYSLSMRNISALLIARHLGVICNQDVQVTGYQIDSRLIGPGELFFALKGVESRWP